jgi:hypothetical protein
MPKGQEDLLPETAIFASFFYEVICNSISELGAVALLVLQQHNALSWVLSVD